MSTLLTKLICGEHADLGAPAPPPSTTSTSSMVSDVASTPTMLKTISPGPASRTRRNLKIGVSTSSPINL